MKYLAWLGMALALTGCPGEVIVERDPQSAARLSPCGPYFGSCLSSPGPTPWQGPCVEILSNVESVIDGERALCIDQGKSWSDLLCNERRPWLWGCGSGGAGTCTAVWGEHPVDPNEFCLGGTILAAPP
jgi:hypothetical protein